MSAWIGTRPLSDAGESAAAELPPPPLPDDPVDGGGDGPHDSGMEARVAKLERDVGDIKGILSRLEPAIIKIRDDGNEIKGRLASQPSNGDGIVCKWIERAHEAGTRRLRFRSENNRFTSYLKNEDEAQVIGRVVWYARRL